MKLLTGVAGARNRLRRRHPTERPDPLPATAWFDATNAAQQVSSRASTDAERTLLSSWVDHGYAIAEQLVPHDLIDEMVSDLDELFTDGAPAHMDPLEINDLLLQDGHRATTSVEALRQLPDAERQSARESSSWRVHGFMNHSDAARQICDLPEVQGAASCILGREARAHYSINFHNGSAQALHEDSAVFHLGVPNLICGAWIACEDIEPGAGPLVYFPGSHRRSSFDGFDNYPLTNLRTADPTTAATYQRHVDSEAERWQPTTFLARKGDVLFWHGMLLHGGSPVTEPGRTRRSLVVHYLPLGVDVADQVTGPTNW